MIEWERLRDAVVATLGPELCADDEKRVRCLVGPRHGRPLAPFRAVADDVSGLLGHPVDDALTPQVATLLFGPVGPDRVSLPPPDDVDGAVRELVGRVPRAEAADRAEWALALGVGEGRDVAGPSHRWAGRWNGAMLAVVALFAHHIVDLVRGWEERSDDIACLGLAERTPGRYDSPADELAAVLAMRCVFGRCECGREPGDSGCNRPRDHHLVERDPDACGFGLFVRQAVRGTNRPVPPLGYLGQGMLARPLDDEYDVAVRDVLTWTCATCGARNESGYCTTDDRPMQPDTGAITPMRRLIVTAGPCCRYEPRTYRRCRVVGCSAAFGPASACLRHPSGPTGTGTLWCRVRDQRRRELG